jgi:competence protein ComEC
MWGFDRMIPGLLVLSIATGIVWADLGRPIADAFVVLWLLIAGTTVCALSIKLRYGARSQILRVTGLGCAAGLCFFAGFDRLDAELSRAREDALRTDPLTLGAVRVAEARVHSRRSGSWGDEVELISVRAADDGPPLPERLLLRLGQASKERVDAPTPRSERLLWPGAWVRIGLRVRPLRAARNPGTVDREHRMARRGRAARGVLVKPDWVIALESHALDGRAVIDRVDRARANWRRDAGERLEKSPRSAGLVRALGLGDRSGVRSETRDAFRRLGLSHLLAVSGLHVGFVAGLAGWLGLRAQRWVRRPARIALPFDWALGMACLAASLYAWITGAAISVERAALLFGLFAVCRLFLRAVKPAEALAWVAAGILLMEPAALFDVGAQLSFGACIALIVGGFWRAGAALDEVPDRDPGVWDRVSRAALATFRASLVVSLGTAPLLVQHGLPLTLLSPIFNVVAIPWTGLLVLPTSLLAVVLAGPLPLSMVSLLMLPAELLEASVVRTAALLPEASGRALLPLSMIVILCGLALLWSRRNEWRKAMLVWVGVSLAGASPSLSAPFSVAPPQVIFFDVGQGDASLIQGRRAVLLIDTGSGPPDGSGGKPLVRALRAVGVDSIDVVAVTHGDLDHRAGAARVLNAFPVAELWLPVSGLQDAPLIGLAEIAAKRGTQVRWLSAASRNLDRGDLEIDVLWPPVSFASAPLSRNESSLVLRVVMDETAFLFTADIGAVVEEELTRSVPEQLPASVLKVAHHGSRQSSGVAFLEAVSPTVAIVSAPCDPNRGLPSGLTLSRLSQAGASLWWTGRDGAVIASGAADGRASVKSWGRSRECQAR